MSNLEYLTSINSRDSKYDCLFPWQREDKIEEKPLEEQPRIYIEEFPEDYYNAPAQREPEQTPYVPYEPNRGVIIMPL